MGFYSVDVDRTILEVMKMAARIKEAYQVTLDKIIAHCDHEGEDKFRAPALGLPHGHTHALSTRGRIKPMSRKDGITEWMLIRSACV